MQHIRVSTNCTSKGRQHGQFDGRFIRLSSILTTKFAHDMLGKAFRLTKESRTVIRFGVWGALNTLIGFSVIMAFQHVSGRPYISNTAGFVIGGFTGYCLHAKKTFSARPTKKGLSKYMLTLAIGYSINILALSLLIQHMSPYSAQGLSIFIYMCYSYLAARLVVFKM
jgi:putative flippase GtrA